MKKAVVTICSGNFFEKMAVITHPTIKAYADKVGADFIVWNDVQGHTLPQYKKMELSRLLDEYARVIYIDTDILIREDAPDLFEIVPEEQLGVFNESPYTQRKTETIQFMTLLGYNSKRWNGSYYNTGVMVFSHRHRDIFVQPVTEMDHYKEQTFLNVMISDQNPKVFSLSHRFNRMCIMDAVLGESRHDCFFMHYAGMADQLPEEDLLRLIQDDLNIWNDSRPKYHFRKKIAFDVQGGLGDQVAAEPAIRFAKEVMYPGDEIVVVSQWPEIFHHLRLRVLSDLKELSKPRVHRVCYTRPDHFPALFKRADGPRVHGVDLCSLVSLDLELPQAHKTPKLVAGMGAVVSVAEKARPHELEKLVLIHPGRSIPSKTFPADVWQSYVDLLVDHGYTVAVVGKQFRAERGIVDFDRSRCLDLVDKLTVPELIALVSKARVLVSNDSAPVQIAGAFDRWIGLISTSRHPEHVLPWRGGSQFWRAKNLERAQLYNDFSRQRSVVERNLLDACDESCLRACLPEPQTVLEFVKGAFEGVD